MADALTIEKIVQKAQRTTGRVPNFLEQPKLIAAVQRMQSGYRAHVHSPWDGTEASGCDDDPEAWGFGTEPEGDGLRERVYIEVENRAGGQRVYLSYGESS